MTSIRSDRGALILTYHAVEIGPAPLCIDPERFRAHLDCLDASGATTLTVAELAALLSAGGLPEHAVALTFDDGFRSVVEHAAPQLLARGMRATVFCVADHLGGMNDWPTQPPGAPRRRLADAAELAELARSGFEIGSHGTRHLPLATASDAELERELSDSRRSLEDAVGVSVRSFAYPYGVLPPGTARRLVERTYSAACGSTMAVARKASDPLALPRVDAHYLRRTALLRRAATGSLRGYIRGRGAAARARRAVIRDYASPPRA